MNRDEIVLTLLAAGPMPRAELVRDTGWGIPETNAVIDDLMRQGRVVGFPEAGVNQFASKRLCLPAMRAATLGRCKERGRARRAA